MVGIFMRKMRCFMIVNVTEQQKKVIESQGYMVVEFKAWAKKVIELLSEWSKQVVDVLRLIIGFFQEMALKCVEKLREFNFSLIEKWEPVARYLDEQEIVLDYDFREKYPFVRSLGRLYRPNFGNRVIYHRCRDRC